MLKPLLTAAEIAERYNVHRQTVYTWMTRGICGVRLASVRIGGSRRVREEDLILFSQEIKMKKENENENHITTD